MRRHPRADKSVKFEAPEVSEFDIASYKTHLAGKTRVHEYVAVLGSIAGYQTSGKLSVMSLVFSYTGM